MHAPILSITHITVKKYNLRKETETYLTIVGCSVYDLLRNIISERRRELVFRMLIHEFCNSVKKYKLRKETETQLISAFVYV